MKSVRGCSGPAWSPPAICRTGCRHRSRHARAWVPFGGSSTRASSDARPFRSSRHACQSRPASEAKSRTQFWSAYGQRLSPHRKQAQIHGSGVHYRAVVSFCGGDIAGNGRIFLNNIAPVSWRLICSAPFLSVDFCSYFGRKRFARTWQREYRRHQRSRVAWPGSRNSDAAVDAAKGAAAVWIAARIADQSANAMMFAGLGALLGHCFPVWLKFKGGKGVATALGVYIVLCPSSRAGGMSFLFLLVVLFWRYVSLGSLSATAAMPLLVYFLWAPGHAPPLVISLGTVFGRRAHFLKHDANLQRLIDGTEPKYRAGQTERRPSVSRIAILGGGSWGTALIRRFVAQPPKARNPHLGARGFHRSGHPGEPRESNAYLPGIRDSLARSGLHRYCRSVKRRADSDRRCPLGARARSCISQSRSLPVL